ncbi:Nesprin-2 [Manis pentadactyla]|nr:Nesprin-2 [Manis pentadactyla]
MFNNTGQMNQGSWRSLERRPGHRRQLPAQSAMASSSQASLTGALGDVCHHSWAMVCSMTADKDELLRDLLPCWPVQGDVQGHIIEGISTGYARFQRRAHHFRSPSDYHLTSMHLLIKKEKLQKTSSLHCWRPQAGCLPAC